MTTALETLFVRKTPLRILVVGDVMIDGYLEGDVGRTSPEAPVPVVLSTNTRQVAGGAANVAKNLQALGAEAVLVGLVGDDTEGKRLRQLLEAARIEHCLIVDPKRETTYKLRVVAQNQHMLRIDRETTKPVSAEISEEIWKALEPSLSEVDGIIVSDYAKGVVGLSLMKRLTEEAKRRGLKICVDPKGRDYTRYAGVFMVTPNRREVGEATGRVVNTPDQLQEAVLEIQETTHSEVILATCGADGLLIYQKQANPVRLPAQASEVFDVTGADQGG